MMSGKYSKLIRWMIFLGIFIYVYSNIYDKIYRADRTEQSVCFNLPAVLIAKQPGSNKINAILTRLDDMPKYLKKFPKATFEIPVSRVDEVSYILNHKTNIDQFDTTYSNINITLIDKNWIYIKAYLKEDPRFLPHNQIESIYFVHNGKIISAWGYTSWTYPIIIKSAFSAFIFTLFMFALYSLLLFIAKKIPKIRFLRPLLVSCLILLSLWLVLLVGYNFGMNNQLFAKLCSNMNYYVDPAQFGLDKKYVIKKTDFYCEYNGGKRADDAITLVKKYLKKRGNINAYKNSDTTIALIFRVHGLKGGTKERYMDVPDATKAIFKAFGAQIKAKKYKYNVIPEGKHVDYFMGNTIDSECYYAYTKNGNQDTVNILVVGDVGQMLIPSKLVVAEPIKHKTKVLKSNVPYKIDKDGNFNFEIDTAEHKYTTAEYTLSY